MSEIALVGKKIGMTREFYKTGQSVPVTVLKMETGRVIQVIEQDKRGYKAVQIGFGKIKNNKLSKAMKGYFAKKNTEPKKLLKEFKVNSTDNYKEGNEFGLEIFNDIKFVDVKSKTIGKGFAGAMKRHNFGGLRASHGVYQFLTVHTDQLVKDKIQEKFLKEKKWLVTWAIKSEQCKILK